MSDRIAVGDVEDLDPGDSMIIEIRSQELGVFNIDGEFYAILNTCPHQNGPIAEGNLGRTVVADPPKQGERVEERYDPDLTVLRCPCHSWSFDITTGENIAAPETGRDIITYETEVEDGKIYIVP